MNFTSQPLRLALGLTLIIVAFVTLCAVKPALTTFSARPAPAPCTVLPVKPPAISEPYLEPGIARTIGPTGAFFSLRDVPRPAIAGIIGNGIVESAADPAASSMFGFGYLMWTGPARTDVIEFAGQLKQPPGTLTVQLAYIWEELRAATWTDPGGCRHHVLDELRAAATPAAAATVFAVEFLHFDYRTPEAYNLSGRQIAAEMASRYL